MRELNEFELGFVSGGVTGGSGGSASAGPNGAQVVCPAGTQPVAFDAKAGMTLPNGIQASGSVEAAFCMP